MNANVSEQEVAKFSALASRWWDPDGPQSVRDGSGDHTAIVTLIP